MNLFKKRSKTPRQLVTLLRQNLDALGAREGAGEGKEEEAIAKRLGQLKTVLHGEEGREPVRAKQEETATLLMGDGTLTLCLELLPRLPFEARKDVSAVFNSLARWNLSGFLAHVESTPAVEELLVRSYENPAVALNAGSMLRELLRSEALCRGFLFSDHIWRFFDEFVHTANFDVASDAFASLRDALTRHKPLVAEFLTQQFDVVFARYETLLASENYVTRRQSLKLLGELLLDRANFDVMMRYISRKRHLKLLMNMLRDRSQNIQFEAFHVFKVFVANPKKPADVTAILWKNREKLVAFLTNFMSDSEDEQFLEEKQLLINTLQALTEPAPAPAPAAAPAAEAGAAGAGAEAATEGAAQPPPAPEA